MVALVRGVIDTPDVDLNVNEMLHKTQRCSG